MILVVDDNREFCMGMRLVLEDNGFQVATAPDVASALNIMKAKQPALILTDVKLPGADGYALLQAVKQHPSWRHIPVVLVTAAGRGESAHARAMGADGCVTKPFDLAGLLEKIEQLHAPLPAGQTRMWHG